jgi:ABC-type multidrug transport system ATPase subunit
MVMLKISFIRKFRAPTIWLEVALPAMFFVFVCLFAGETKLWTDPAPSPEQDEYIPFTKVPGPAPQYGMIPDNANSHLIIHALQATAIALDSPAAIEQSISYFQNFDDYNSWIQQNRKVEDTFYAVEWQNSEPPDFARVKLRLSTNGLTVDSLPDFVRNVASAFLAVGHGIAAPTVFFNYSPLPSDTVFRTDEWEIVELIIFSTVLFIPPILTAATNYGTEAESGLRDLFMLYGLSLGANRVRWYAECFIVSFVLSIPFAIALSAIMGISFGLLLIHFLLSSSSIVSFAFALIALQPTQALGRVVGLGTLMVFFVVFFWALFSWLYTDQGYWEKRILSIFPSAAIPYTMGQIVSGHCISLANVEFPDHYSVRMGFAYMAIETVVYYIVFVLAENLKATKWFKAPVRWGKGKANDEIGKIAVDGLIKIYGDVTALDKISFSVDPGETLAIIGPNGAGKSTLLAIMAGCRSSSGGHIAFAGLDITEDIGEMHSVVGYCPQENLFMNELNAPEWIHSLCVLRGIPDFDYSEIFSALGLNEQVTGRIGSMSGGNKRKVCLASALIGNPAIIILDEATSGVDFTSRTRIWSLISGLTEAMVIMATHTLEECEKIADRIMVLSEGTVAVCDTPNALRREFKCGYLIETEELNGEQLRAVIQQHGLDASAIEITDERARVVISAEEHGVLGGLLKDISFKYLMSIQNLEEKVFAHIQEQEMARLQRRDSAILADDREAHPAP